ncbi:MAG: alpha/beta hydrolase [Deltaproteobacteria bacterium]|nr:alpha/beta hydrolase [Deltaproteobacteria bacterium]MBW2726834.1 alpha/beta hydrolase [Deltaproteobacteria bacterium]
MQKALIIGSVVLIVVLFALYFGAACGMQRRAMYPRPPAPPGDPQMPRGTEVVWLGPEANVEAWFMRPFAIEHSFPVVIFTHGNGELIDYWAQPFTELLSSGVGVMLVEYPGYGRSGGAPSQGSITQIMLAAYDFIVAQPGVDNEAIVAYGRSLGGGAACVLATERPLSALVLESTFTSVRAMAPRLGFPSAMIVDPFDNLQVVSSLDIPVLVLHGEHDMLIPVSHGEALAAAAETELVRMPCGHNDCPFAWPIVESFMSEQGLLRH